MINNLFFKINKPSINQGVVAVCGNIPELGEWEPRRAYRLVQESPETWTNQSPLIVQLDKKIQFKIITLSPSGEVEWESLPRDLNRKFRVSRDVLLEMKWSDSIGKKKYSSSKDSQNKISRQTSLQIQKLLKTKPKKMMRTKKQQHFNPFHDAYNSQSQDECSQQNSNSCQNDHQKFLKSEFSYLLLNQPICKIKNPHEEHQLIIVSLDELSLNQSLVELSNNAKQKYSKIIWISGNVSEDLFVEKYQNIEFVFLQVQNNLTLQEKISVYQNQINRIIKNKDSKLIILNKELNFLKLKENVLKYLVEDPGSFQIDLCQQQNSFQSIQRYSQTSLNNIRIKYQNFNKYLLYDPLICEYKQFDLQRYQNSKTKSNNKLYVFDLNIFIKSDNTSEAIIDTQSLNKVKGISNKKDSCVIVHTDKSSSEVDRLLRELLQSNPKFLIIASNGQEIWFNKEWMNVKLLLKSQFQSIKKLIKKYNTKYLGDIIEQYLYIEYTNQHRINYSLINQLKSIINDKTLIKIDSSQNNLKIYLPFNNSLSFLKIIQLRYLHRGYFDMVFTLISDSNRRSITKQVSNLIQQFPSFFNKEVQQYHLSMGMEYFSLATHYVLPEQWNNIQL